MVTAIDDLNILVNECTSANCSCKCDCRGSGCSCEPPKHCSGNPCPGGISQAVEKIKDLKEKIKVKKEEIDKIIDEDVPEVLENLKKAEDLIYPCLSEEEVDPEWLLLDCARAIGNINSDGEKVVEADDCQCKESEECKKDFEMVKDYQCQEVDYCYVFNFSCCRAKK